MDKNTVTISVTEYTCLRRARARLNGLEAMGVDNWPGYSDGLQLAKEENPDLFDAED